MPSAKRLLFSALALISLFVLVKPTNAAINPSEYRAPEHAAYSTLNLQTAAIPCAIIGTPLVKNQKCPDYDKDGGLALYDKLPSGGALGGLSNVMMAMYTNPPTSTHEYLADLGTNLGIIQPVFAQVGGSGNGVIEPVLKMWQISRNLAYFLFVIVFLVTGFMIMFRAKINPQTVISIQVALPGLIVGLILVTFSY